MGLFAYTRRVLLVVSLLLPLGLWGCDGGGAQPPGDNGGDNGSEPTVNWSAAADSSSNALVDNYWNVEEQYFNYGNQSNTEFHYWPQAHALDVLLDAYRRTDDDFYLSYINDWYEGVPAQQGDTFINSFYDDMEWNALAMLRAHQITGQEKFRSSVDVLWEEIKGGWTDTAGGGIMWAKHTPNSKNAISNAPASVLASRLYQMTGQQSYLDWSTKIYSWQKETLVNPNNGAVWDHVEVQEDGSEDIQKDWVFSYNQGMFLGAALELYEITGDQVYLNDAIQSADYALNSLTNSSDQLLEANGGGDGGLFNGIFVRYLAQLILEENLSESERERYARFLRHNAEVLWTEGTYKGEVLYGQYWVNPPGANEEVDLTVQLSGAILIETVAHLKNEEVIGSE